MHMIWNKNNMSTIGVKLLNSDERRLGVHWRNRMFLKIAGKIVAGSSKSRVGQNFIQKFHIGNGKNFTIQVCPTIVDQPTKTPQTRDLISEGNKNRLP